MVSIFEEFCHSTGGIGTKNNHRRAFGICSDRQVLLVREEHETQSIVSGEVILFVYPFVSLVSDTASPQTKPSGNLQNNSNLGTLPIK